MELWHLCINNFKPENLIKHFRVGSDMKLEFWKLTGAGNDFVALDNRDAHIPETGRKERIIKWCRRGLSIGADGVLLIEPSTTARPAATAVAVLRASPRCLALQTSK